MKDLQLLAVMMGMGDSHETKMETEILLTMRWEPTGKFLMLTERPVRTKNSVDKATSWRQIGRCDFIAHLGLDI